LEIALVVMGPPPNEAQRAQLAQLPHVLLFTEEFALEWMEDPWTEVDAAGEWLLEVAEIFAPDVVHLSGYAHAALDWGVPVIVVAHSCALTWWRAVNGTPAPNFYAEYRRRISAGLCAADLVVAPTAAMLQALEEEYGIQARSRVIPNGRNGPLFRPASKDPVIISAGRLWDEAKNFKLLEEIGPTLLMPLLAAGGSNPERPLLGCRALGVLSEEEIARELSHAAIYASPAFYEPFGLSILEAALCGCALVLGDIPSLRELWQDAAVFLEPSEPDAWRNALNKLANDEPERIRLGTAAAARARQYGPSRMAREYLSAYDSLLEPLGRKAIVR
jgi:glycosyltransferase involved in cell wall biosynthesis